ncbi:response regulator transcription factor [Zavarzinia compransoris]|uniref:DNA-binding response regulator n=1 Tax=Zavarzinia compransoris TaxID=1264899 RepID=A0A317DZP5_9PROT|nr:response regulator transcription factor [Zavarzinia compransoris]PWR18365.1 DNA-binding response regulator [Zavarzinia compransoris]
MQILLIDDDAELAAMLTEYLGGEGFTTTIALNGEAGVEAALSGRYDAVLLDVMLPRLGGIDVLRRVRESSRVPVIMLTAKGADIDRATGLEMGADDYVPKPCYPRELVARLRAVLRRSGGDPGARADDSLVFGGLSLSPGRRQVAWGGHPLDLTVTEFRLLEMLLLAGARVSTKDELSEGALGRRRQAYDRSVDVHMSNLRHKLTDAAGEALTVETVRGVGYRLGGGGA